MKLLRYKENDIIKADILDDEGKIRDASSLSNDWTSQTVNLERLKKLNEIVWFPFSPPQAENLGVFRHQMHPELTIFKGI